MAKPFDASTRFLIERHPEDWLRLLGIPASELEALDSEALDTDVSTVTAQTDGVFRLKAPAETLLHLELETGHHGNRTPDALLRYSVLLTAKYGLPVQSSVILLRPEADSPALTGFLERRRAKW
jgi:predicted transposase YdaD